MSKRYDKTSIGGSKEVFQTTHWSEIGAAKTHNKSHQENILNNLIKKYWRPVYCYLLKKGYDNETTKDLTQSFFYEIFLGKGIVNQADQSKGRFRTFLLTALDRYVISVHRKETAQKRLPAAGLLKLDAIDSPDLTAGIPLVTPDQAFLYTWATDLIDQTIRTVKEEYYLGGKAAHWDVFAARLLRPIIEDQQAPTITELCEVYGIDSESRVSNMIVTVKRRFRSVLREQLRKSVKSDDEVDQEFRDLFEVLSQVGAG
jgi:RNA polymerase sigma-70 factor (ECF subfamily)